MQFMIIEHFKNKDAKRVGDRFAARGRMMPEGVAYLASWIDPVEMRCFQVMEAPSREALQPWIDAWSDIVTFEIVPVQTSPQFWAGVK